MPVDLAGFALRLAYARWLRFLAEGEAPTNADLGASAGRTGQWISNWARRLDAPPNDETGAALARYLGVPAEWLFENQGPPPRPELWEHWRDARGLQKAERPAGVGGAESRGATVIQRRVRALPDPRKQQPAKKPRERGA